MYEYDSYLPITCKAKYAYFPSISLFPMALAESLNNLVQIVVVPSLYFLIDYF